MADKKKAAEEMTAEDAAKAAKTEADAVKAEADAKVGEAEHAATQAKKQKVAEEVGGAIANLDVEPQVVGTEE